MAELVVERALPPMEPVGDGWTVEGLAVPYERDSRVTDDGVAFYTERFAVGSFTRDAAKGGRWVNLMVGHHGDEGDRFLGRCTRLWEESGGLAAAFRLDRNHPDAEAARSGELVGWSVSARIYRSTGRTMPDGSALVVREACGLSHVAATPVPQYAGAGVLVARDHVMWTEPSATPRLDALRALGFGVEHNTANHP